jgi:hypothetical protein
MRALLHVLATIALLPYLVLASGFLILGHAISSGTLFSFFGTLLAHAVWIIPWGLIGFASAMVLVAVLGIVPRFRRFGALCLCLLAAASLAVIIFMVPSRVGWSELLFLLPCMLVLIFGGWSIGETPHVK